MKALAVLASVCLALTVSVKAADSHADEAAIRARFTEFQAALAKGDGEAAAALVSKQTISYYGSILKLVLDGDEATVREQKPYRKMMVLLVRHGAPKLAITNASEFFVFVVSQGLNVGSSGAGVGLGKITMDETMASAPVVVNGEATPANFFFSREGKDWKVELVAVLLRFDQLMAQKQKVSSLSEDEAIIRTLEARSGRPVSKDIWKPLKDK